MEAKTNAIAIIVVVIILLFITIAYKIKGDRKSRSLAKPYKGSIKSKGERSFLATTPSIVLAILTTVVATFVLFGIGEGLSTVIKIEGDTAEALAYIFYDLVIASSCFFIIRQNPGSIWYIPVICNILGIISAIVEPNFWITPMWIPICAGWGLSLIASIIGARLGRRRAISDLL